MPHSISRTAQPISYYIGNEAIDALQQQFGEDYLDSITAQQKALMVAVLADHMASESEQYTIVESLACIDGDKLLGDRLWRCIESIAHESDASELSYFLQALTDLIYDHARVGDFD